MPADPIASLNEGPEDTPETPVETEAPTEDTPSPPAVDYQDRYNNLRPEFDRTKQQLAEEREARERFQQELEQLRTQSVQPDYDDGDFDEDDLADPVARRRLAAVEAALVEERQLRAQQEAAAAEEAKREQEYTYIDTELETLEKRLGEEFDDDEADWIGNYAGRHRDEHGRPDVGRAYEAFSQILERRKQKWVETKPTGGRPAVGSGAVEVPDLDDPDQRVAYLNQALGD